MSGPVESTYQGYIASTHDALLIFECVRRGILPKVKRRLRDDERKLIRSGQVFVFDEKESGIKRWTDGLLWSPSRILWNFLVYRQVEKRQPNNKPTSSSHVSLPSQGYSLERSFTEGGIDLGQPSTSRYQYTPSGAFSAFPSRPPPSSASVLEQPGNQTLQGQPTTTSTVWESGASHAPVQNRFRSVSAADSSYQVWQSTSYADVSEGRGNASAANLRDNNTERELVGSLTTSYPFAKDGLCKKTISIQTETSTQHLISYYSLEDVRSGRLRTPSSLPEIASLSISPIFLTKTTFRFPPVVAIGPDGVPRFRSDETQDLSLQRYEGESSGEGTSSGSDSNARMNRVVSLQEMRQHPYQQGLPASQSLSTLSNITGMVGGQSGYALPSNTGSRYAGIQHDVGIGLGPTSRSRGMSDVARGSSAARNRYLPYKLQHAGAISNVPSTSFGRPRAATGSNSSISTSASSTPSTPFVNLPINNAATSQTFGNPSQLNQFDSPDRFRSGVAQPYAEGEMRPARPHPSMPQNVGSPFASILQDMSQQPYDFPSSQYAPSDQQMSTMSVGNMSQQVTQQQGLQRQGTSVPAYESLPSGMQAIGESVQGNDEIPLRRPYTSVNNPHPFATTYGESDNLAQIVRPSSSGSFVYRHPETTESGRTQQHASWQPGSGGSSFLASGNYQANERHFPQQISGLPALAPDVSSQSGGAPYNILDLQNRDGSLYSGARAVQRGSPVLTGSSSLAAGMMAVPSPQLSSKGDVSRPSSSHRQSSNKAFANSGGYAPGTMGDVFLGRQTHE